MSFWQSYRAQLKPLSVEEPIDAVWHRFLAYFLARAANRTPITPDQITMLAIVVGLASGVTIGWVFPHHLLWGGALLTFSAVLDCADGQLARMRKSSSAFGRMLDGTCDLLVMLATFGGTVVWLVESHRPFWLLPLAAAGGASCSFHFGWYDHYKSVYLRFTEASYREGEDYEHAVLRHRETLAKERPSLTMRFVWWVYLFYLDGLVWLTRWSDPYTSARLDRFPAYDAARAAIYEKHVLNPMRVWRSFFGLGSHVFLFSVAIAFDKFELYILYRLGVLNFVALFVMLPWQRRASRAAFEEMGLARELWVAPGVREEVA